MNRASRLPRTYIVADNVCQPKVHPETKMELPSKFPASSEQYSPRLDQESVDPFNPFVEVFNPPITTAQYAPVISNGRKLGKLTGTANASITKIDNHNNNTTNGHPTSLRMLPSQRQNRAPRPTSEYGVGSLKDTTKTKVGQSNAAAAINKQRQLRDQRNGNGSGGGTLFKRLFSKHQSSHKPATLSDLPSARTLHDFSYSDAKMSNRQGATTRSGTGSGDVIIDYNGRPRSARGVASWWQVETLSTRHSDSVGDVMFGTLPPSYNYDAAQTGAMVSPPHEPAKDHAPEYRREESTFSTSSRSQGQQQFSENTKL